MKKEMCTKASPSHLGLRESATESFNSSHKQHTYVHLALQHSSKAVKEKIKQLKIKTVAKKESPISKGIPAPVRPAREIQQGSPPATHTGLGRPSCLKEGCFLSYFIQVAKTESQIKIKQTLPPTRTKIKIGKNKQNIQQ